MTTRIKIAASTLATWREDELASYEDRGASPDHPYAILGRFKTTIEVRDVAELDRLIESGRYHAGAWDDRHAYRAAVARAVAKLEASRNNL
jgi:hypothetical protein